MSESPLLRVDGLTADYGSEGGLRRLRRRQADPVVYDVSFGVPDRSTLGLVGESGSGKTTILRAVAGLHPPRTGEIVYDGRVLANRVADRTKDQRREIQYVFQNPDASLNPRRRVCDIIGRPLQFFMGYDAARRTRRIEELLGDVHLDPGFSRLYPSQLSGGQRQRVAIARALAAEPRLLLCDEILTALDVSVQKRILDLLEELQVVRGLSYLFVSHDLGAVRSVADEVLVLSVGEVMEQGRPHQLFRSPLHPYSKLLIDSIPHPDKPLVADTAPPAGEVPAVRHGNGCVFAPRCPERMDNCTQAPPPRVQTEPSHMARCYIPAMLHGQLSDERNNPCASST